MSCLQASYSTKNGHSSSINISKTASGNASIYLQKKKKHSIFSSLFNSRFFFLLSLFLSLSHSDFITYLLLPARHHISSTIEAVKSDSIYFIFSFSFFFFSIYSLLHHPLSHALSLSFFLSLSHAFIHSLSLAQSLSADIDKQTYYFIGTYTH